MVSDSQAGKVQTVLAPIDPGELGVTLTHEHLLLDTSPFKLPPREASARRLFYENPHSGLMSDVPAAIGEVGSLQAVRREFPRGMHPCRPRARPVGLARISRATGVNIIMGSSHYVAHAHPPEMDGWTEDDIVEEIVSDVTEGVRTSKWEFVAATPTLILEPTGIKSGVIGEVGCSWPLDDNERKVLRASGAHSGLPGRPFSFTPGETIRLLWRSSRSSVRSEQTSLTRLWGTSTGPSSGRAP